MKNKKLLLLLALLVFLALLILLSVFLVGKSRFEAAYPGKNFGTEIKTKGFTEVIATLTKSETVITPTATPEAIDITGTYILTNHIVETPTATSTDTTDVTITLTVDATGNITGNYKYDNILASTAITEVVTTDIAYSFTGQVTSTEYSTTVSYVRIIESNEVEPKHREFPTQSSVVIIFSNGLATYSDTMQGNYPIEETYVLIKQ